MSPKDGKGVGQLDSQFIAIGGVRLTVQNDLSYVIKWFLDKYIFIHALIQPLCNYNMMDKTKFMPSRGM